MKLIGPVSAVVGALIASQGPEFTQQYAQRLAGAETELRARIVAFDEAAAERSLTRGEALSELATSGPMARGVGESLRRDAVRAERLGVYLEAIRAAPDLSRPIVAVRALDWRTARGAAEDYRPAMPVTVAGAVYAGAGAVLVGLSGGGLAGLLSAALGGGRKRRRTLKSRF